MKVKNLKLGTEMTMTKIEFDQCRENGVALINLDKKEIKKPSILQSKMDKE